MSQKLRQLTRPSHIIIDGPIGAGKTTFGECLAKRFNGVHVKEPVTNDPYLPRLYDFIDGNKKEAHVPLVMQYWLLIMRMLQNQWVAHAVAVEGITHIQDRYILLDRAFQSMFKGREISEEDYEILQDVMSRVLRVLPRPDIVIGLRVTPQIACERRERRARDFERPVTVDYLIALDEAYERVGWPTLRKMGLLLEIDWNADLDTDNDGNLIEIPEPIIEQIINHIEAS